MTVASPETSAELEELFNDGAAFAELVTTGKLAGTIKGYVQAQLTAKSGDLVKQTREGLDVGIQAFLQEQEAQDGARPPVDLTGGDVFGAVSRLSGLSKAAIKQKVMRQRSPGMALNRDPMSGDWGTYLSAIHHRAEQTSEIKAYKKSIRNAMSERVPSEGGFLVPETLRANMLMLTLESAIFRPRARIIPMDSLRVPYPTIDDPTHANGTVYGGVSGQWTEEGGQLTASQPSFGRIVLEARKLTAYTEIPNELLQDSIEALDQFFSEMFPEALAFFEDDAFINGDGVAMPEGILNATCAVSVDRQTTDLVQFADIAAMYPRMLPQSLNRAIWLCSPDVIGQLLQLVLGTLDSNAVSPPLWLQSMQAQDGVQYTILGRPLIVSEKIPELGVTGDLTFVDPGYYLIGDRQSMQVSSSDEYKFQNDLTAFRVIERLDGRAWLRSALTPANGSSNTLSPIVTLNSTQAS